MRTGRLRHRITIEKQQRAPDGQGGSNTTWETFVTVWADVQPLRGTERLQSQQVEAKTSHKITIRHCPGLCQSMRINFDGRLFNIRAILNFREIGHFMEIMADEGVAQ